MRRRDRDIAATVHPLQHLRRVRHRICLAGGVVMLLSLTWAIAPLPSSSATPDLAPPVGPPPDSDVQADRDKPRIDRQLFADARLWNPLPPPPAPEAAQEREIRIARPNLQLIGIIEDPENGGTRYAALYNPEDNRLLIVAEGERIEPYIVASIDSETVVLRDGRHEARLWLKREERAP
jgi:hypothetical protein